MSELGAEVKVATAVDPAITMIRARLGVDEIQAQDLARIQVACPMPGVEAVQSLGEFMISEHAADKVSVIMDLAVEAQQEGKTPEQSLSRALGFSAIKDKETGSLLRVPEPKQPEPKKKLARQPSHSLKK